MDIFTIKICAFNDFILSIPSCFIVLAKRLYKSFDWSDKNIGSGALSGKILLVRIVENIKIDTYYRAGYVKQWFALPRRVRKGIKIRGVRAPNRGYE